MANASVTRIQFKNDEIFAAMYIADQNKVLSLGYKNKGNTIIDSYLILLSVGSDWGQIVQLATSIQATNDENQLEELHEEFYDITKLYFDEFKSEILRATGLNK